MARLRLNINDSQTTLPVDDTTSLPTNGGVVLIESEKISYTYASDTALLGCTRGYNSTSATSHAEGKALSLQTEDVPRYQPTELRDTGAPTDNLTGVGFAETGARYTNVTNGDLYLNSGTPANPQWDLVAEGEVGATWGDINGDITDQTDLQDALDEKLSTTGNQTLTGDFTVVGDLKMTNSLSDPSGIVYLDPSTGIFQSAADRFKVEPSASKIQILCPGSVGAVEFWNDGTSKLAFMNDAGDTQLASVEYNNADMTLDVPSGDIYLNGSNIFVSTLWKFNSTGDIDADGVGEFRFTDPLTLRSATPSINMRSDAAGYLAFNSDDNLTTYVNLSADPTGFLKITGANDLIKFDLVNTQVSIGANDFTNDGYNLQVNGTTRLNGDTAIGNLIRHSDQRVAYTTTKIRSVFDDTDLLDLSQRRALYSNGNIAVNFGATTLRLNDDTGTLFMNSNRLLFDSSGAASENFNSRQLIGSGGTGITQWSDTDLVIGQNAFSGDASSILTMNSTSQGFLPPRMTTTERDAIATPAEGLVIYNSTTQVLNFYNGTTWGAV